VFFLPNPIALPDNHVTVVEERHIMSVKYCLPVPFFHFWPQITHPAERLRCRVGYLGPKVEEWNWETIFYRHYRSQ